MTQLSRLNLKTKLGFGVCDIRGQGAGGHQLSYLREQQPSGNRLTSVAAVDFKKQRVGMRRGNNPAIIHNMRICLYRILMIAGITFLIASCGGGGNVENKQKPVKKLVFRHWMGVDASDIIMEINSGFMAENPDVEVVFENNLSDSYAKQLTLKLSIGDAPDVFGVYPGPTVKEFSSSGYLMDLSEEPYVDKLMESTLYSSRGIDGRLYVLPIDQNVIGVVYNKKIFMNLDLTIPKNWDDFLLVCEKINKAGISPLALGAADKWINQLIPYSMAPSMIYADNIGFDDEMYKGRREFNGPEWRALLERYHELVDFGFFNEDFYSSSYEETIVMMSLEQAAMVVNGNWILPGIIEASPDIELGMFPLPAVQSGEDIWISSAVGGTLGIFAATEYPEEAKNYLRYWIRPGISEYYLSEKLAFPVLKNANLYLHPVLMEIEPYLSSGHSYPFLDQNWPLGVQEVFKKTLKEMLFGIITIDQVLDSLDAEWAARTAETN